MTKLRIANQTDRKPFVHNILGPKHKTHVFLKLTKLLYELKCVTIPEECNFCSKSGKFLYALTWGVASGSEGVNLTGQHS